MHLFVRSLQLGPQVVHVMSILQTGAPIVYRDLLIYPDPKPNTSNSEFSLILAVMRQWTCKVPFSISRDARRLFDSCITEHVCSCVVCCAGHTQCDAIARAAEAHRSPGSAPAGKSERGKADLSVCLKASIRARLSRLLYSRGTQTQDGPFSFELFQLRRPRRLW